MSDLQTKPKSTLLILLRDLLIIVVLALAASYLIKTFVVRAFSIPSPSMQNTLMVGDTLLVEQFTGKLTKVNRGDVIVFKDPGGWLAGHSKIKGGNWFTDLIGITSPDDGEHLVKRVIGVPGDVVECCTGLGKLSINGAPINEKSYLNLPDGVTKVSAMDFKITVPEGMLWVLGDNRYNSSDSRYNQSKPGGGFVPIENVVGRAFVITWPIERWGQIDNHSQLFKGIPVPVIKGEASDDSDSG